MICKFTKISFADTTVKIWALKCLKNREVMHGANYRRGNGSHILEKSSSRVNHNQKLQNLREESLAIMIIVFSYSLMKKYRLHIWQLKHAGLLQTRRLKK
jgi:hypothetical protein